MRFANRPARDNSKTSATTAASLGAEINLRLSANDTRIDR
ncbi:hypothetical protein NKJ26_33075 [Mesorhizobium sp. M0152]